MIHQRKQQGNCEHGFILKDTIVISEDNSKLNYVLISMKGLQNIPGKIYIINIYMTSKIFALQ